MKRSGNSAAAASFRVKAALSKALLAKSAQRNQPTVPKTWACSPELAAERPFRYC
jgi:hypothetical protein